jgi:hypothetical protein
MFNEEVAMEYVDIKTRYDYVRNAINLGEKDEYEAGTLENFRQYVQRVSPKDIKIEKDEILVSKELITTDYVAEYKKKTEYDYSARDCVQSAFNRLGMPPLSELSMESITIKVREIMNKYYRNKIYIKYTNNNIWTQCVSYETMELIKSNPEFLKYVEYLKKKVDKKISENIPFNNDAEKFRYENEQADIDYAESMNYEDDSLYNNVCSHYASETEQIYLMTKALFSFFFSEFDVDKYNSYQERYNQHISFHDYDEECKYLSEILASPNFKNEFYHFQLDDVFINAIADKISDKVIEKLQQKKEL